MADHPFGAIPSTLKVVAKTLAKTSQHENGNYAKILASCEAFGSEVCNQELLALAASISGSQEQLYELLSKGEKHVEEYLVQRANEICKQQGVKLEVVQGQWFGNLYEVISLVAPEDKMPSITNMRTKSETELLASAAEELKAEITVIDADRDDRSSTRAEICQTRLNLIKYKNGLYSIVTSSTNHHKSPSPAPSPVQQATTSSIYVAPTLYFDNFSSNENPTATTTATTSSPVPQSTKEASVSVVSTVPAENIDIEAYKEKYEDVLSEPIVKEGAAITVIIRCTSTAQKLIASRFGSAELLAYVLTKAIRHMQTLGQDSMLDRMFGRITLGDRELTEGESGSKKRPLLPDTFKYDMLDASEIEVAFKDAKGEYINDKNEMAGSMFNLKSFHVSKVEYHVCKHAPPKSAEQIRLKKKNPEDTKLHMYISSKWFDSRISKIRRFINFLCHCGGIGYSYITRTQVNNGLRRIAYEMIGVRPTVDQMLSYFQLFTSSNLKVVPRGIILYGPPGTGKTTLVKKLLEQWNLCPVCPPLASGDFQQKFKGDAEEMVNKIALRAATIPWEMAVLGIDEIEGFARDRKQEDSGTNLLSVILSIIGGIKDTKNLILFGSTNHIEKMDEAFLRRMNYQIFIGKPSFVDRQLWLTNPPKVSHLELLKFDCDIQKVVEMTCNFSHDAMGKTITYLSLDHNAGIPLSLEKVREKVNLVSEMMRIYFGRYILAEMLQDVKSHSSPIGNYLCDLASNPIIEHNGTIHICSKRILVNLKDPKEHVQVECLVQPNLTSKIDSAIQEMVYQAMFSHADGIIALDGNKLEHDINFVDDTFLTQVLGIPAGGHMKDGDFIRLISMMFPEIKSCLDSYIPLRIFHRNDELRHSILKSLTKVCQLLRSEPMNSAKMEQTLKGYGLRADLGAYKPSILQECIKAHQVYKVEGNLPKALNFVAKLIKDMHVQAQQQYDTIKQTLKQLFAVERKLKVLKSEETLSSKRILQDLVKMGLKAQLNTVQYIDSVHMARKEFTEEQQIIREILRIIEECKKYPQSMVIFDLDSLAEVSKEYSGHKNELAVPFIPETGGLSGPSFSYKILRPNVLAECLRIMISSVNEDPRKNTMWLVALSGHNYIIQLFNEKLAWPKTKQVAKAMQQEMELDQKKKCVRCGQVFTERDNNETQCSYHESDEVYLEQEFDMEKKGPKRTFSVAVAKQMLMKKACYRFQIKYACCQAGLDAPGELRGCHEGPATSATSISHDCI